ncbi:MAG: hypothetical protein IPN68_18585 [Bacteroidetes bacterium]|nr:hypothetical protein [Bacteroidota bacterium]
MCYAGYVEAVNTGGVVKIKYTELVKFLSLKEQIKDLESQAKEISDRIKSEFGDHGGEAEIGGILISCKRVLATQIDKESLTEDIGVERLSKHQYQSSSVRLEVKPKSDSIKSRIVKKAL